MIHLGLLLVAIFWSSIAYIDIPESLKRRRAEIGLGPWQGYFAVVAVAFPVFEMFYWLGRLIVYIIYLGTTS